MGAVSDAKAKSEALDNETSTTVVGKLESVIYARLAPGADLYRELKRICKENGVRTGIVMTITGGMEKATLQLLTKTISSTGSPEVVEIPGPFEASGHGLRGTMRQSNSGGIFQKDEAGSTYLHVHLTMTVGSGEDVKTWCGHLIEGCIVRSKHPISHFTVVIGKVAGVELELVADREHVMPGYPDGYRYHSLTATK